MAKPRIIDDREELVCAEIAGVCVVVWRAEVTWPRFVRQCVALQQVVERNPGGAGFLCIVESQVKPPSAELRSASIELLRSHEANLSCMAGVIEARGFMGAVTRSVLSSMTLLARNQRAPQAHFSSAEEAARWMSPHLGFDADELASAVANMRKRAHGTALLTTSR